MGAPEPKSVHDRLSKALDHLEKLTSATTHDDHPAHVEPKTVEEAVGRLKDKVPAGG